MLHILANPHSGHGRPVTRSFCRRLKEASVPFRLHITDSEEEARALLTRLSLGPDDTLLLIGGDGSISGAVNSLDEESMPALMLLSTGSGNDFARGMGMDAGPDAALSLLARAENLTPALLDCGEARIVSGRFPGKDESSGEATQDRPRQPRRFAVSCGIGYDAGVCGAINRSALKSVCNRLHIGKIAYLILGIRQIFLYKKASLTLTFDDHAPVTYRDVAFASVHNLPCEGGGFLFAPGAVPRDGKLNLCLVTAENRLTFALTLLMSLLGGKHVLLPNVRQISCRRLAVHSDTPEPFHTDGEVTEGVTDFSVRVLPRFLRFLYALPDD